MISIENKPVPKSIAPFVRKISIFKSRGNIHYLQKLTPSPYTYLAYSHGDMPVFISGEKRFSSKEPWQITGPKVDGKLYVEYAGSIQQVLLEFTGTGFFYLFHISPTQLLNSSFAVSQIYRSQIAQHYQKALQQQKTIESILTLIYNFIQELALRALPPIHYVEKALTLIESHNGAVSVKELLQQIYISERQFNRKFKEAVGVTPKCYAKIIQLHYIIYLMQRKDYDSIQTLAYQSGFYDLSHFDHRFKELTGLTPIEFINSDSHIALKYFKYLSGDTCPPE